MTLSNHSPHNRAQFLHCTLVNLRCTWSQCDFKSGVPERSLQSNLHLHRGLRASWKPAPGSFFGPLSPFLLCLDFVLNGHTAICLQTSQTQAGWNSIMPAGHLYSLCASANLICSPLLPTPQKHKEPFLPPSPPHKSKQENWTANGLRIPLWGQTLALGQGYSLAHLTGCKYLYACFSCNKQYRAMHVHNKKCKPKGIHWKTSLPPSLTLGFPPQRKQLLLDYFALWML